ncbi:unnamed protein product [Rhizophagus irregularis]|uniref:Uncharacterized protein n=1 Tax=Rhizophagus irregularis TaxID=588596 RepID=A0A915ZBQ1_9GLOM|nr:unnamed protein product [Rhizophagus irregularis]
MKNKYAQKGKFWNDRQKRHPAFGCAGTRRRAEPGLPVPPHPQSCHQQMGGADAAVAAVRHAALQRLAPQGQRRERADAGADVAAIGGVSPGRSAELCRSAAARRLYADPARARGGRPSRRAGGLDRSVAALAAGASTGRGVIVSPGGTMRHRRRVRGERLGAAQRHRQLGDFQRVEEGERLLLAALQDQREGRSGTGAMARIDVGLALHPRRIGEEAEIADSLDLGVATQEATHLDRIFARAAHAQFECLQAAHQHPRGIGVADRADRVAHQADRVDVLLGPQHAACDQIAMAAGIFGQRVDDDIGTMFERLEPERAEEGVVDRDRWFRALEDRVAARGHGLNVDQRVGRVGGAFEIDQRDIAGRRLAHHRIDLLARRARRKIEPMHAEAAENARDQRLGCGIKRPGMDDRVAGLDHRQEQRRDRRHAAGKDQSVLGLFPYAQAIFEDFLIRPVEARIDQPFGAAGPLAGHPFEMALACGGIGENIG